MEHFLIIVNDSQPLTIITKRSILDVEQSTFRKFRIRHKWRHTANVQNILPLVFLLAFCAFYKAFFVFMTVFYEFMKLQSFEWLNKIWLHKNRNYAFLLTFYLHYFIMFQLFIWLWWIWTTVAIFHNRFWSQIGIQIRYK